MAKRMCMTFSGKTSKSETMEKINKVDELFNKSYLFFQMGHSKKK
jgi:hypothetical protein